MLRNRVLLFHHVFLLADFSEPRVLEGLRGRDPIVGIVDKKFLDQIGDFGTGLGDQLGDALSLNPPHPELSEVHVRGVTLEFVK